MGKEEESVIEGTRGMRASLEQGRQEALLGKRILIKACLDEVSVK